ncbi:MAG: DUF1688 family protein [Alphaproteobacteria bacterium]|nr:DUF1688 family protein [Alphaproteobacteria bacterium]
MPTTAPTADAVHALLSAAAVRARARQMLAAARAGALAHFTLDEGRLDDVADLVVAVTRAAYPDGVVPYHSRWRHFGFRGVDRFAQLYHPFALSGAERGRARVELAIVSVLLDAGAGDRWHYQMLDGSAIGRSEGLALASLDLVANGGLSTQLREPWRVDAAVLQRLDASLLGAAMQSTPDNPLVGVAGRAALLQALGDRLAARPDLFGTPARLGNFFDVLAARAVGGQIQAAAILDAILDAFNPIWPGRIVLAGIPLGDVWRHDAIAADDGTAGLMPFHKLSQWLAYSLVEPLEEAGLAVNDLDGLTGLAEYRNGGLFVDAGALVPHDVDLELAFAVDDPVVVEWRALTVALLDLLADRMRARLGLDAAALPLAKVLQGGTWTAGRQLAAQRRPGGGPPIKVASDGTVF